MRSAEGSKPIDLSILKDALRDNRVWCGLGLVVKRDGEDSHYEIVDNDVLIEIDLMPEGVAVTARLGSWAGGKGSGLWRIPPVGTEVAWMCPCGTLDSDTLVVGTFSSGEIPADLDEDTLVIINPKKVVLKSQNDDVTVDADGQVLIQGGDEPIARETDPVKINSPGALALWMSQVESAISGLGGTVPTPAASAFLASPGIQIKTGSSKAKCG